MTNDNLITIEPLQNDYKMLVKDPKLIMGNPPALLNRLKAVSMN